MLNGHIVKSDTGNIARNGLSALVDRLADHTRDIRYSSECRFHFLHFVRLDREVVLRQDAINERLFFLPLKCDLDFLVHQEVSPVLANLFRHT